MDNAFNNVSVVHNDLRKIAHRLRTIEDVKSDGDCIVTLDYMVKQLQGFATDRTASISSTEIEINRKDIERMSSKDRAIDEEHIRHCVEEYLTRMENMPTLADTEYMHAPLDHAACSTPTA